VFNDRVELEADDWKELRALTNGSDTPAPVATRARIVMWLAEGRQKKEIAALAGVSRPTVDLWLKRYEADGIAGLIDRARGAGREQMPGAIRARILAATRTSPPAETGLSHWSSREMAAFIKRTEGVYVSHYYVAKLWRETGLKPHQQGTFKVSKDPAFADKVADIVGHFCCFCGSVRGRCAGCGAAPPRSRAPGGVAAARALRAPLDLRASAAPSGRACGQAGGLPDGVRSAPEPRRAGGRR
jgi:transposase